MSKRIHWLGQPPAKDPADLRVERLNALARQVFHNPDKAARWLHRPRREFGGVSPLEMMDTAAGARQVEALLKAFDDSEA